MRQNLGLTSRRFLPPDFGAFPEFRGSEDFQRTAWVLFLFKAYAYYKRNSGGRVRLPDLVHFGKSVVTYICILPLIPQSFKPVLKSYRWLPYVRQVFDSTNTRIKAGVGAA